jgi:hypothetical protein
MKKSLALLDELIYIEEANDKRFRANAMAAGKSRFSLGESQMLFHLKQLKGLMEEESKPMPILQYTGTGAYHEPITLIQSNPPQSITTGIVEQPQITFKTFFQTSPTPAYQPQGCIDTKYCRGCKIVYHSSICVCALHACSKCEGWLSLTADESTKDWERIRS